ncbi:DMT family transporter [Reinekea marinisedimentorum]|uniref:EamA-like transporter family protein n=1 Tax=Reinekea marinisedimentorum TaxID=230495 RepID=A0A4R3IDB4_9GAMM|nr:DMT family transporter [Reinekea marinisedimentorum]TCS43717.1 EamA-like transporter family protein [Reinekea marinisedimentorum]
MWILFALTASMLFGTRAVLYQWMSQRNMNRNLMLCGVFSTGFVAGIAGMIVLGQGWSSWAQVLVGISLGVGSYSANASLYKGFAVGKAAVVSVLSGLPPLFVVLVAFLAWGEALNPAQLFGFCIIFAGILLIRYSNEISFANLQGAHWGLLAAAFFTFTDLMAKQSTRLDMEMFSTLTLMFGSGSLLFALSWLRNRSKTNLGDSTPCWSQRKTFFGGMAVGVTNVAGVAAMLVAFSSGGPTGLVSAIAAMNVMVVLLYSRLVLKDVFRRVEIIGISAALAGIVILRVVQ